MSTPSPFALLVIDETIAQRYSTMTSAPMLEPSNPIESVAAASGLLVAVRALFLRIKAYASGPR